MSCCNSNNVNSLLNRCSKSNRGNNLVNHFNKRINELENKELNLNNISSNIIPDLDQTYNLGSEEKKFKDLYLSGNTLYLGSIQLKDNGGTLEVKDSNGQNALDLTTIEEQVNKNSEDITILNNKINKNIEVTNNLLVTGNLCYQDKPVLYSNINEISSSIVVPVQSSGIYKNNGSSQITLTLDGTSETTTLESGNSKLIYASTTKLFSVQTNLPELEALELKGIMDFTGGFNGRAIHLYANNSINDLSIYGIGIANNGGGTDGEEYTFPSISVSAGDHILVCRNENAMNSYMNASNIFDVVLQDDSAQISQNGDDAIELFKDGVVIETFGDINLDGTGEAWEYLDSWAYKDPSGTVSFGSSNWIFGGINVTDGTNNIWEAANVYPFAIGKQYV